MSSLTVTPLARPPMGRVDLPGSSLAAAGAMTAAALADGASTLSRVPIGSTTRAMVDVLRGLGASVELDEPLARIRTQGWGGHLPEQAGEFDCGPSALAAHLTVGLCGLGHGEFRVDASAKTGPIRIGPTVEALRELGAQMGYEDQPGHLPVTVRARGLRGGRISLRQSSPGTLAALLTVSPHAAGDVFIELAARAPALSAGLVCEVMDDFGVAVIERDHQRFIIAAPQRYRGLEYTVPPDPLEAAVVWMIGGITGGSVELDVAPAGRETILGFALDCFERFGADVRRDAKGVTVTGAADRPGLHGAEIDLTGVPDLLPPIALTALFASGPTRISGVPNDDRTRALIEELSKLGAAVEVTSGEMLLAPPGSIEWVDLDAHDQPVLALSLLAAAVAADHPVTVGRLAEVASRWTALMERLNPLQRG